MILKIDVPGAGSPAQIKIAFNFNAKQWSLVEGNNVVWGKISASKKGRFDHQTQNSMQLWDAFTQILELYYPPKFESDKVMQKREGRILMAVDRSMKHTKLTWTTAAGVLLPEIPAQQIALPVVPTPVIMTAFRRHLIDRLKGLLPAPYNTPNNQVLAPGLNRETLREKTPGYTNCGSLPGFVTAEMARFRNLNVENYLKNYFLNGTNLVRRRGQQYHSWVENDKPDGSKKPSPGDIYALLNRGSTDKQSAGISHVGVIQDTNGTHWKTMDLGQGVGGFDGRKDVEREYKPETFELSGEANQGGGFRVLAGWVDVDKYLAITTSS